MIVMERASTGDQHDLAVDAWEQPATAEDLAMLEGIWISGTVRGHLTEGGWGSALGFPAVIPDEQGDMVAGWVFSSDDLVSHWARLDEFEGEAYQRIEVTATLDNGTKIQTFVYALDNLQHY